jgi:uncharacterized protein YunC (DUF1805 family)
MLKTQKIQVGDKTIEGLSLKLQEKTLVVLRGGKGYVMCGYLNLEAADKFNDVAVIVTGVSSIEDALKATVHSYSRAASSLGITQGQPIKDILSLIA